MLYAFLKASINIICKNPAHCKYCETKTLCDSLNKFITHIILYRFKQITIQSDKLQFMSQLSDEHTQVASNCERTNDNKYNLLEYRNIAIPTPSPLLTPVRNDVRKHGISLGFFPSNHSEND